jgi:hypothetical protein
MTFFHGFLRRALPQIIGELGRSEVTILSSLEAVSKLRMGLEFQQIDGI